MKNDRKNLPRKSRQHDGNTPATREGGGVNTPGTSNKQQGNFSRSDSSEPLDTSSSTELSYYLKDVKNNLFRLKKNYHFTATTPRRHRDDTAIFEIKTIRFS